MKKELCEYERELEGNKRIWIWKQYLEVPLQVAHLQPPKIYLVYFCDVLSWDMKTTVNYSASTLHTFLF